MLLGGDLGLLYSAAASAVAVVIGLLAVRWKWQNMLMQREEIRRRMAWASEEAARVELEATSGYSSYGGHGFSEEVEEEVEKVEVKKVEVKKVEVEAVQNETLVGFGSSPGRQMHPCELCFCPTKSRCKQCKSVHYCSARCQIIHWRQGHKDKCQLFSTHQNTDTGVNSLPTNQYETEAESTTNAIGIGKMHTSNPTETSTGETMFSSPNLHVLNGKNDTVDDVKGADMNHEASVNTFLGKYSQSAISSGMSAASDSILDDHKKHSKQSLSTNTSPMKPLIQEQPTLTNNNGFAVSTLPNALKSDCIEMDEQSENSAPSNCKRTNSEDYSLSQPSTPASGFWGGTIEPTRTNFDTLDNLDDHMSSDRDNVRAEVIGSDANKFMDDTPLPVTSISKKSTASSEVKEDTLKFEEPLFFSSELSKNISVSNASVKCISKMEEAKSSSSSSSHEHKKPHGHVQSKHLDINNLQSLSSELRDNERDTTGDNIENGKGLGIDSREARASKAQLSSSTSITDLDVHSVENEYAGRVAAAYSENSAHVQNFKNETNLSARTVIDQLRPYHFIRNGSLSAENWSTGRYEGSFPYELFVKLYNWKKVELCPRGLLNCGNSCYANAVLQCLTFTPPLTAYFLQGLHSNTCVNKEWCFTCEFEALVKKAKEGYSPLSPARIISKMHRVGRHLGNGKEEDAHEFLRYAIDAMQSICVKETRIEVPSSLDEETTLMGLTFGGYLRSKIECMTCGGKSEQNERIMDLTVEIGGDIGTLEDALHQFTRTEILDGENKYHCDRCKSYEKAKKKLRILEAPNVLTVALKRFQLGKFGKLNKAVKFPDILNLASYMSGTSDKSPIYALYGVVVHLDVMNASFSGHYVCYVKNNQGRWFQADDSTVQPVDLGKVLSKGAYMLLYARCSPRAPRLLRKAKNPICKSKSHPAKPWDREICSDCFYLSRTRIHSSSQVANSEDDSSSEHSSTFFSEAGSNSTESSNRESTSTDESFDLGDLRNCFTKPWRNSSDSDTSSPSSSPSPLHLRHSRLADLDRYSSEAGTSGSYLANVKSNKDSDCFWTSTSNNNKSEGSFLSRCPDAEELVGSGNCRKNEPNRLSRNNYQGDNVRGIYLRSMTGRID